MKRKIAILLPIKDKNSLLNSAFNIVKMLHHVSKKENFEIVFSCVSDFYNINVDFKELIDLGIEIRETNWKKVSQSDVAITLEYMQNNKKLKYPKYLLPTDGIKNFTDCDFWLLVSDQTQLPIAPVNPYAVIVYDYTQRYIPRILTKERKLCELSYIQTVRDANFVLTTTPQTCLDTIQYAGIDKTKCIVRLMEFNIPSLKTSKYFKDEFEYFVWQTNGNYNQNYENVFESLKIYLNKYNGKLKIIMIFEHLEFFCKNKNKNKKLAYIKNIKEMIKNSRILKENIIILDNLDKKEYFSILYDAKFLLHPILYDGGTLSVVEAAYHNIPSISSAYPQMEYINDRFKLNMKFFNAYNPYDIAKCIKESEENYLDMKELLPTQKSLEKFSPEKLANEFWEIIRDRI